MEQRAEDDAGLIHVHVPTGTFASSSKHLARRLTSLRDARIGVLDNCKEFADIVLKGVAEVLQRDHGVKHIEFRRKAYPGATAGKAFLDDMAHSFDAVVNGVGH